MYYSYKLKGPKKSTNIYIRIYIKERKNKEKPSLFVLLYIFITRKDYIPKREKTIL